MKRVRLRMNNSNNDNQHGCNSYYRIESFTNDGYIMTPSAPTSGNIPLRLADKIETKYIEIIYPKTGEIITDEIESNIGE